jgi:hypothetical protein
MRPGAAGRLSTRTRSSGPTPPTPTAPAFPLPDILCVRSCRLPGVFVIRPCLPCGQKSRGQQGPFAPWELPQLIASPNPSATLSPSFPFPVEAGYRSDLLQRFLSGTRRASPVAQPVLVIVLSLLTPPEWLAASVRLRRSMLPSPLRGGLGLWTFALSRPSLRSLSLRPDDLLTIPKMALSIGFKDSVSFLPAIQATRPLTLALVGLSPTERASLRLDAPRSVRISRTTRSCTLHDKGYGVDRVGAAAQEGG